MPGQVPLRTDYIADIGEAYGRGQTRRSLLQTASQEREMRQTKLDEYYREEKFLTGFSDFLKQKKAKDPEYSISKAGVEYSNEVGRPDKAVMFEELERKNREEARSRLATFTDAIAKMGSAGILRENEQTLKATFPEFKDVDFSKLRVDENKWVEYETPDGGHILSHGVLKRAFYLPPAKKAWVFSPKPIGGKVAMVNKDNPAEVFKLGPWPKDAEGGAGGDKVPATIQLYKYMEEELDISKPELKNWILRGKTKSDEQIALEIIKGLATSDMGPIDFDKGLSDPESKEGEKLQAIYGMVMKALSGARAELGEERAGVGGGARRGGKSLVMPNGRILHFDADGNPVGNK